MNLENISPVNFVNYPSGDPVSLQRSPGQIGAPSVSTAPGATFSQTTPTTSNGTLKHVGTTIESKGLITTHSPWIFIVGIIAGILIVLLIVALMFAIFVKEDLDFPDIDFVVADNEINDTTGSSANGIVKLNNGALYLDSASCSAGPTREWTIGQSITFNTCDCLDPFFGTECFRESYVDTYTSIGTPAQSNIVASFGSTQIVDRLSFPFTKNPGRLSDEDEPPTTEIICTKLCDQDQSCLGVWWTQAEPPLFGMDQPNPNQKPTCQLIRDQVVVKPGTNIPYSSNMDSVLYLKKDVEPEFKDRVFVYQGQKPLRYWTVDAYSSPFGDNQSQTMFNRQLVKFNWSPQIVINSTGCDMSMDSNCPWGRTWYGFFSNQMINLTDNSLLKELIDMFNSTSKSNITVRGREYVVVGPKQTQLIFPSAWSELWGVFVNPTTIPNLSLPEININTTSRVDFDEIELFDGAILNPADNMAGMIITRNQAVDTLDLNTSSFPLSGEGKFIVVKIGDRLEIISTDQKYHDLVSTTSEWYITNNPINFDVANPFRASLSFNQPGIYYLKDRMHPRIVRLIIQVT
uniref:Uncharacterized protein n=1 Tax=Pithovirus LCPAC202 TaxID=2506592 RepID=A0A481Z7Z5_9VIRU|nr:MAG: hypothetical protein LCPAC202_02230 [Pithovirus LCPAC202]